MATKCFEKCPGFTWIYYSWYFHFFVSLRFFLVNLDQRAQVWTGNLQHEFSLFSQCLRSAAVVAIDTEFPGVIQENAWKESEETHYRAMKDWTSCCFFLCWITTGNFNGYRVAYFFKVPILSLDDGLKPRRALSCYHWSKLGWRLLAAMASALGFGISTWTTTWQQTFTQMRPWTFCELAGWISIAMLLKGLMPALLGPCWKVQDFPRAHGWPLLGWRISSISCSWCTQSTNFRRRWVDFRACWKRPVRLAKSWETECPLDRCQRWHGAMVWSATDKRIPLEVMPWWPWSSSSEAEMRLLSQAPLDQMAAQLLSIWTRSSAEVTIHCRQRWSRDLLRHAERSHETCVRNEKRASDPKLQTASGFLQILRRRIVAELFFLRWSPLW